jgi:Dienelactone hydrolase family
VFSCFPRAETLPETTEAIKAAGKTFEPQTYPGAGHGFMRTGEAPDASEANRQARDASWSRWKTLLEQLLRRGRRKGHSGEHEANTRSDDELRTLRLPHQGLIDQKRAKRSCAGRDARHHTRDGYAPQAAPMALGNT